MNWNCNGLGWNVFLHSRDLFCLKRYPANYTSLVHLNCKLSIICILSFLLISTEYHWSMFICFFFCWPHYSAFTWLPLVVHVMFTMCSLDFQVLFTSPLMWDAADALRALEVYFWQSQFPESKEENLKIKRYLNTKLEFHCDADCSIFLWCYFWKLLILPDTPHILPPPT